MRRLLVGLMMALVVGGCKAASPAAPVTQATQKKPTAASPAPSIAPGLTNPAGGNLLGQAGGNVIAVGGGNVIATGGGNAVQPPMSPAAPEMGANAVSPKASQEPVEETPAATTATDALAPEDETES